MRILRAQLRRIAVSALTCAVLGAVVAVRQGAWAFLAASIAMAVVGLIAAVWRLDDEDR